MKKILRSCSALMIIVFVFSSVVFAQKKKRKKVVNPSIITMPVRVSDGDDEPPKPKPTPKPTPPPTVLKTGVVNEKYVSSYKINSDGTYERSFEIVRRYDSEPQKKDQYINFDMEFNADLDTVKVDEAFSLKPSGVKNVVPTDKIKIQPTEQTQAAPTFSSMKILTVKFKDVVKNDKLFLKFTLKNTKPVFRTAFDTFEIIDPFETYRLAEINIIAPSNLKLLADAFELKGGKISEENGLTKYQWKLENYSAKNYEIGMPYLLNFCPRLSVTSVSDFEKIGELFQSETVEKTKITPEIQKLADEITKDKKTPEEKANAIYQWTNKNIRYLFIVLDRGGWIPHDSTTILQNGYGDCKDYTILLQTLLKAENIESFPTVVRLDNTNWFTSIPTFDFFNHMILYVPSLNKFADATIPKSKLGDMSDILKGKKGILLQKQSRIIDLPDKDKDENKSESLSKIEVLANGKIKSLVSLTSNNDNLGFEKLGSEEKKSFAMLMKFVFLRFEIDGEAELLKYEKTGVSDKKVNYQMDLTINNFIEFEKNGKITVPSVVNFANWKIFESVAELENRTTPLSFSEIQTDDVFEIKFPKGVKINAVPQGLSFENETGKYLSKFKLADNTVFVRREFAIKKSVFQPNEYPPFREFLQKVLQDVKAEISYSLTDEFDLKSVAVVKKNKPKKDLTETLAASILGEFSEKTISASEAKQYENLLLTTPDNKKLRTNLIHFYSRQSNNDANKKAIIKHILWFIETEPEQYPPFFYGRYYGSDNAEEFETVKKAWLKKLAENPKNDEIRLNIAEFMRVKEAESAEKLLSEGEKINAENYKFYNLLYEILKNRLAALDKNKDANGDRKTLIENTYLQGEKAWNLIKTERTYEAEAERRLLLISLSVFAFENGKVDQAEKMATELVLEYGEKDDSAHIGNTVLGLIAVQKNDIAKAKEYLLLSIKAPLRDGKDFLEPNMKLAKAIYLKGEKNSVAEFLRLCEQLQYFKESYTKSELDKLKLWQTQIIQGKTPSFELSGN